MKNIYNDLHNAMNQKIWFEIMYQLSFQLPLKATYKYGSYFNDPIIALQIKAQK